MICPNCGSAVEITQDGVGVIVISDFRYCVEIELCGWSLSRRLDESDMRLKVE
jgi:hypothetical protein